MQRVPKQRTSDTTSTAASPTTSPGPVAGPTPPTPSAATGSGPRKRRRARTDLVETTKPSSAKPAPTPKPKPSNPATAAPAKRPRAAAKDTEPKPAVTKRARLSALDAAVQVLSGLTGDEAKLGVTAQDLIDRMAKQKLWASPGGKTPQATLYAAMVWEITSKGATARFRKVSRGHFTAATNAAPAPRRKAKA